MEKCNKCKLYMFATKQCEPKGTEEPMIYFIGEAPGPDEDKQGKPFVGRAGKYLHDILDAFSLNDNNCRFFNMCRCMPRDEENGHFRAPNKDEVDSCIHWVCNDIMECKPKVVVTLGNVPSRFFIGDEFRSITKDRGNLYKRDIEIENCKYEFIVIPTYHPSYLIRNHGNSKLRMEFKKDIKRAIDSCIDRDFNDIINNFDSTVENDSETVICKTYEEFRDFIVSNIDNTDKVMFDLESNAKEVHSKDYEVVGFSLAGSRDRGCYVPMKSLDYEIDKRDKRLIEKKLSSILVNKKVGVYNYQHEEPAVLNWLGVEMPNVDDIFVKVKLMMGNADTYRGNGGLKAQSMMNLGYKDWSEDLDKYFRFLIDEDMSSMRSLLSEYYTDENLDNIMDIISRINVKDLERGQGNTISYGYVPCNLISRYGSIDSSVLFDLENFYDEWMEKESSKLGIDLKRGYKYWMQHHIAAYNLEKNGAYWNESKVSVVEEWCNTGMKDALEEIIKSPLTEPYIRNKVYDDFIRYLVNNNIQDILGDKVIPKRKYKNSIHVTTNDPVSLKKFERMSLFPDKKNIVKLELGNIKTLAKPFIENNKDIFENWYRDYIKDYFSKDHTINEYKCLVNPNATSPEWREFISNLLISDKIRYAKLYMNIRVLTEEPSFSIDNYRNDYDRAIIKLVEDLALNEELSPSDRFDRFMEYIENNSDNNYQSRRLNSEINNAINYKLESLDADSMNEIYELYLMCHMDVEDRSTWNDKFRWLFNYKIFKKLSKIISTYINGKVGRNNVWLVDKEELESGSNLVKRETLIDKKTKYIPDGKATLLQTNFSVNTAETGRWQCLSGDTMIPLLDGRTVPLEDLEGYGDFYVYSYDHNRGHIVPGYCKYCKCTGKNVPILEIKLDNGEVIKCTPEHKFMKRNGHYIEAKDIKPGQSLMPLYRRESKDGYEEIYLINKGIWSRTHHVCQSIIYGDNWTNSNNGSYYVSHHKDFNKRNNDPRNLCRVDVRKHYDYHSRNAKWNNEEDIVRYADNHETVNHKVLSVKFIGYIDKVYDLHVEKYHNFALDSGVIVHNSGIHNLPAGEAVKGFYTSRFPGGCIICPDGSQMEIRTLAAESGDKNLIQAFKDGLDIHRFFASAIYNVPYEDVEKWQRGLAKNGVFGIVYGESEQAFANQYLKGDLTRAHEIFELMFDSFPSIKEYIERKQNQYKEFQKVTTITQRYITLDNPRKDPGAFLRAAQNYPIQAAAEDIAGVILYEFSKYIKENNLKSKLFCFIHDSIEIDVHPKELFRLIDRANYLFNEFPLKEFGVPVATDIPVCPSLGQEIEIKSYEFSDDFREGKLVLDGYEDDMNELEGIWKSTYRIVEGNNITDPDPKYIPWATSFLPKKAELSRFAGKYRSKLEREYKIIM